MQYVKKLFPSHALALSFCLVILLGMLPTSVLALDETDNVAPVASNVAIESIVVSEELKADMRTMYLTFDVTDTEGDTLDASQCMVSIKTANAFGNYTFSSIEQLSSSKYKAAIPLPNVFVAGVGFSGSFEVNEITLVDQFGNRQQTTLTGLTGTLPSLFEDSSYDVCGRSAFCHFDDSTGTLTIFGQSAMSSYIGWANGWAGATRPWDSYANSVRKIVIEDGVISIGDYAFYNLPSLTNVVMTDVSSIGNHAFSGCTSLTSIESCGTVAALGTYAFANCSSLSSVDLFSSLASLSNGAFSGCSSLTSVEFSENLSALSSFVFTDCTSLTSVRFPEVSFTVWDSIFTGCSSLTEIIFTGDAPRTTFLSSSAFPNSTATAYYPTGNDTWTEDVMNLVGSTLNWVAKEPDPSSIVSGVPLQKDMIEVVKNQVTAAPDGTSITVDMISGSSSTEATATIIPVEILVKAKGKDVELVFDMGDYSWTINGKDIDIGVDLVSVNMEVTTVTDVIPDTVVDSASAKDSIQISLTHEGEFNFAASLKYYVGTEHAGKIVKLYYYVENALELIDTATADAQGYVLLDFDHASDYLIVVTDPLWDISFTNMTFAGSLEMNFAFEQRAETDWTGFYAQIVQTYADGRDDMVANVPVEEWGSTTIAGVKHYTVTFNGIAREKGDDITVTIYNADGVAQSNVWTDNNKDFIYDGSDETLGTPDSSVTTPAIGIPILTGGNIYGFEVNFEKNIFSIDPAKTGMTVGQFKQQLAAEVFNDANKKAAITVSFQNGDNIVVLADDELIRTCARVTLTAENEQGVKTTAAYDIVVIGDVNRNGEVDSGDASLIQRYFFGEVELNALQIEAADTNRSGEIESGDAVKNQVKYNDTANYRTNLHNYTNYVSNNDATCTADHTCHAKTVILPNAGSALGHKYVRKDDAFVCEFCGKKYAAIA